MFFCNKGWDLRRIGGRALGKGSKLLIGIGDFGSRGKIQIIIATSGPSPFEYVLAMILKIVGMGAEIGARWNS